MNNKQIKTLALIKLKGNWGNCLAITFAMSALLLLLALCNLTMARLYNYFVGISYIPEGLIFHPLIIALQAVRLAFYFIILSMIHYIIVKQFADISYGLNFIVSRNAVYGDIKHFFKISVLPNLLKYLIIIGCVIPGLLAFHSAKELTGRSLSDDPIPFLILLFFMLSVLVMIFSVILTVSSIVTLHILPVLMTFNPELSAPRAIFLCFKLTDGRRIRMIHFYLSFLKYLPLCLFVYPIFLLVPYFTMSDLILQYDIIGDYFSEDKFFTVFEDKSLPDDM